MSAKSMIDYYLGKGLENFPLTCLINTDMSAAFDTVDHGILIRKLNFYGLNHKGLQLFKSLLENRSSYIELEGFLSKPIMSQSCSVLQGSKLSGILFLIYVNEVPKIHELLKDKILTKFIIGEEDDSRSKVEHNTINSVDDSGSIVSFEDENEAENTY